MLFSEINKILASSAEIVSEPELNGGIIHIIFSYLIEKSGRRKEPRSLNDNKKTLSSDQERRPALARRKKESSQVVINILT